MKGGNVTEKERIFEALRQIFCESYLQKWLDEPNSQLGGRSPREMIEKKNTAMIWAIIREMAL